MTALDTATQYWLSAINQPIGLGLIVSDPGRAKTQLYAARKKLLPSLPSLASFSIRTSPVNPSFELYLLRTEASPLPEDSLDLGDLVPNP